MTGQMPFFAASSVLHREAVYSRERVWTWHDVHVASLSLADRLIDKKVVVNMCESYIGFLVTWLAAIRCGALQILPGSDGKSHLGNFSGGDQLPVVVVDTVSESGDAFSHCSRILWTPDTSDIHIEDSMLELPDIWTHSRVCLYTSGSTGTPQPELKTVSQLIIGAQVLGARISEALGDSLGQISCLVSSVATRHMFGVEAVLMLSLIHDIAVLNQRPLLPADVSDALQLFPRGTVWITTPLHLRALSSVGYRITSCRAVLSSTMPLDANTARCVEHLFQAPVVEVYGSTETGAIATRQPSRTDDWKLLKGVKIEPDSSGLWVRSSHCELARRLNDIVHPVMAERFRLLGRSNDMIKVAGHRASLSGLNLIIQCVPGLEDSVLYMPSSGLEDQRPVLIYAGERISFPDIKTALDKKMVSVFIPRTLIQVKQLPSGGKGRLFLDELDRVYEAWLSQTTSGKYLDTCTGRLLDE